MRRSPAKFSSRPRCAIWSWARASNCAAWASTNWMAWSADGSCTRWRADAARWIASAGQPDRIQELLGIECGHATEAGGGDRLPVDVIGDVAGREHAAHRGGRGIAFQPAVYLDIAVAHVELAFENAGVGRMADRDEHAGDRDVALAAVGGADEAQSGDAGIVAQHFVDGVVPHQFDLAGVGLLEQFVLQDFFSAQLVAPVHQRDLAADVGKVQRFLDRSVAAADHRDVLVAEEEAVAGRARRHAFALEGGFRSDAEILRVRAGGDDQRIATVFAAVALQLERALFQVDGVDV